MNASQTSEEGVAKPATTDRIFVKDLKILSIQAGERTFYTTKEVLHGAGIFKKGAIQPMHVSVGDGILLYAYFDMDGDLFDHILRYLREGLYPVCVRPNGSADIEKYGALAQWAKGFEIPGLVNWIEKKGYMS